MKARRGWCSRDFKNANLAEHKNFVRCADCGRRLKVIVKGCGDYNCWHYYLPPHKGKYK